MSRPELSALADVQFVPLFNLDSINVQIAHWQRLAKEIYARYEGFDGFVVLHGTDTLACAASALSFMLQGLAKPVVMTGSLLASQKEDGDAWANIRQAVEMAKGLWTEICVCFGQHLFRGNRVTKINSGSQAAFASPNYPPLDDLTKPEPAPEITENWKPALRRHSAAKANAWTGNQARGG